MPEEIAANNESEVSVTSRLVRWWQRPTIRELKKHEREGRYSSFADDRNHARTRLPEGESVHLGGVVLTEIFTPSTLSHLVDSLKRWPTRDERKRQEWLNELSKSRTGERIGAMSLGSVRRPGTITFDGVHDPHLPDGVEAVWLYVEFMLPSIVAVVATFMLDDEVGDLSPILKTDYPPGVSDTRVHVFGRFGRIRARLPWARPARAWPSSTLTLPDSVKHRACEDLLHQLEQRCRDWFIVNFKGRFAQAPALRQPTIRLMFAREHRPFTDDEDAAFLGPAGLHRSFNVYREPGDRGWSIRVGEFPRSDRYLPLTMAARREDLADQQRGADSEIVRTLAARFDMFQAPLASRFALMNLLGLFTDRLANLRDLAGVRTKFWRPVSSARLLDNYLVGDGLDASTVAPDIERFTQNVHHFNQYGPKYLQNHSEHPANASDSEPQQLIDLIREVLARHAVRCTTDTERTTGNLRGSAEPPRLFIPPGLAGRSVCGGRGARSDALFRGFPS